MNCGKELPEDANFCLKCGKPQHAEAIAATSGPRWETCVIQVEIVKDGWGKKPYRFWGQAIGPKGSYSAGQSEIFKIYQNPNPNDPPTLAAHRELIVKLTAEGWEPTGQDAAWWMQRFRRRVAG